MPVPANPFFAAAEASGEKNIWVAAGEGDLDRVRRLVETDGYSITAADAWTYTPLHAAASYGQVDVLRYLLSHPSAPEDAIETTDNDGDTPLFAVEDVEVARLLVEEFSANVKHENNAGNTPAAVAEENELLDLAAYFRSITGEAPMYERNDGTILNDDDRADTHLATLDEAVEERTEALMGQVQEILQRAEARGAQSGEELNEGEEEDLRRVVGESLFSQIREGWGSVPAAGARQQGRREIESDTAADDDYSDADRIASVEEESEDAIPQPGR